MDSSTRQRLDQAAVVDFLGTMASALSAHGGLGSQSADQLRLALGAGAAGEVSLVVALAREPDPFFATLVLRYGALRLYLNLVNFTARPLLMATQRVLAGIGAALLNGAELMFNQTFAVRAFGRCEDHSLWSTALATVASELAETSTELEAHSLKACQLYGQSLSAQTPTDQAFDQAVAEGLGFHSITPTPFALLRATLQQQRLSASYTRAAATLLALAEQVHANSASTAALAASVTHAEPPAEALQAAAEGLATATKALSLCAFDRLQTPGWRAWEERRLAYLVALGEVHVAFTDVLMALPAAVHPSVLPLGPVAASAQVIPDAVARRLALDLSASGVAPAAAEAAVASLLAYLEAQGLSPQQVLPAEASRLHPQLLPTAITQLRTLTQAPPNGHAKAATLAQMHELAAGFQALGARLAPLLLLGALLLSSGCGLKTRPQSSIPELRPDLPFRVAGPVATFTTPLPANRKAVDANQPDKDTQPRPQTPTGTGPLTPSLPGGFTDDYAPSTPP